MMNFLKSLKAALNKNLAYSLLDHLKDYKSVYAALAMVSSVTGVVIEADKVSNAVVAVATVAATVLHAILG